MIGQESLLERLEKYSIDTFPHTLLLEGSKGSGKHLVLDFISEHLHLPLCDITDKLDLEFISEYHTRPEPYLYIIDSDKLSVKNQNTILKFIEEPLNNSFIILISTNRYKLLNTIINRCTIISMNKYNLIDLRNIFPDISDKILSFCDTPGDVINLKNFDIENEKEFVYKVLCKMNKANFFNIFKIKDHIALNNEMDKLPLDIFFKIAKKLIIEELKNNYDANLNICYNIIEEYYNKIYLSNIDLKYLFDNFLITLWKNLRGEYGITRA